MSGQRRSPLCESVWVPKPFWFRVVRVFGGSIMQDLGSRQPGLAAVHALLRHQNPPNHADLSALCQSTLNGVRVPLDLCGSIPGCLLDVRGRIAFKYPKLWQGIARVPAIFAKGPEVSNYILVIH